MSKPVSLPSGEKPESEKALNAEEHFRNELRGVFTEIRKENQRKFLQVLRDASQPTQEEAEKIPTLEDLKPKPEGRTFGVTEIREGVQELYDSLPGYAKKIRNPKSDFLMAEFLRAVRWHNHQHAERMVHELNDHFNIRATYAEGATGTGSGAPFLPLPLANLVIKSRDRVAKIRPRSQRFTSISQSLTVPTSGSATAAMVGEGSTASQGEPTLGTKVMRKKKAQAKFIATDEFLEDSAFNLVSFFSERAGSALGQLEDVQFCTSDGNAPNITESLESATITDVDEAVAGTLTYPDVVALFFALPEPYRNDSQFFGNSLMMQFLSTIVDGNGRPIFTPIVSAPGVVSDSAPGQVGTIFGRPVIELPLTTDPTGPPTNNTVLMIGNLNYYGFLDGGAMTIRTSEHVGWASDQIQWKITERIDGVVLHEAAFRTMLGISVVG